MGWQLGILLEGLLLTFAPDLIAVIHWASTGKLPQEQSVPIPLPLVLSSHQEARQSHQVTEGKKRQREDWCGAYSRLPPSQHPTFLLLPPVFKPLVVNQGEPWVPLASGADNKGCIVCEKFKNINRADECYDYHVPTVLNEYNTPPWKISF